MEHIFNSNRAAKNTSASGRPRRSTATAIGTCAALFAALAIAPCVHAQRAATEYEVKAAYLYNFGKFVAWPDKSAAKVGEHFEICVLGEDPFGMALDTAVTGETIGGKGVAIKRISKPQDVGHCRVVFISASEAARLSEILATLDKASVLTVSDMPEFSQRGGMIEFVLDGNRVRFEVNVTNAEDAGLNLSAALLKVAVRVTRNARPGI
jgi:hypothetical protein